MTEVWSRQKDIQYSSRTRQVTDQMMRLRREHKTIRALLAKLPPELRDSPEARGAGRGGAGKCSERRPPHLPHAQTGKRGARDFELRRTMHDHWVQGREAVSSVIARGNRLLAENIVSGRSAAFDLALSGEIKEKKA